MRPRPLPAASLLVLSLAACGHDAPGDLADDLAAVRDRHGIPALAAAITDRAAVTDLAAVGRRRADRADLPVGPDDQFHLGSCTKAMTATLIAQAVDAGDLRWDLTLAEALPGLAERMHPAYRAVTLPQLLAHRAGAWTDLSAHAAELATIPEDAPVEVQRARFAELMLSVAPELPPGTATGYSNAGYLIAGAILEARYQRPWEELVTTRLFAPLGMTSCGFGPPGRDAVDGQPWGHRDEDMIPVAPSAVDADNPPALGPAGTVHCNLADWARFARLHLGAHPTVLSPAALAVLHTPVDDGPFALGWLVGDDPVHGRALLHDGSNTRWYAVIAILPDEERAVMAATNAASVAAQDAVGEAIERLLAR